MPSFAPARRKSSAPPDPVRQVSRFFFLVLSVEAEIQSHLRNSTAGQRRVRCFPSAPQAVNAQRAEGQMCHRVASPFLGAGLLRIIPSLHRPGLFRPHLHLDEDSRILAHTRCFTLLIYTRTQIDIFLQYLP